MPRILSTALGLIALALIEGASSTEPLPTVASTLTLLTFVPFSAFSLTWLAARRSRASSVGAEERSRRIVVVATVIVFVTASWQGRWWDLCLTWCPPEIPVIHRVLCAIPLVVSLAMTRPWLRDLAPFSWRPVAILGVPYLVATGLIDLSWYTPDLEEAVALDPFLALTALFLMLASMLIAAPRLLGWLWKFRSLEQGPLRDQLEVLASTAAVRVADIRIWLTDMPNACVVGLLPSHRFVYLTQGLIDRLDNSELLAVHAHELGHVRRGHLWVLLTWLTSWLLLLLALDPWLGDATGLLRIATYAAMGLIGTLGFAALSRQFEHEADLCAAMWTAPELIVDTLRKVSDPTAAASNNLWKRHPGSNQRIALLTRDDLEGASEEYLARSRRLRSVVFMLAIVMGGSFALSTASLSRRQLDRQIGRADFLVSSADRRIFRRGEIGPSEDTMLRRAVKLYEHAQVELIPVIEERSTRQAILGQLVVLYEALGDEPQAQATRALMHDDSEFAEDGER